MKIRTITLGFSYDSMMKEQSFLPLAETLHDIKNTLEDKGYAVQTIRMSTQPWEKYAQNIKSLHASIQTLYHWTTDHHIDYFNIGPTQDKTHISWIPDILQQCPTIFCTTTICNQHKIFMDSIQETARVILKNARLEANGFANLRFAALCNIPSNTPFYPASYHGKSKPSFSLGLENSDLVYKAFQDASSISNAKKRLEKIFLTTYKPLSEILENLSKKYHIHYDGLDVSVSTSIHQNESIAYAFEQLLDAYHFGYPGTLALAKIITETIQNIPIKKIGYCGLMLPVLEDHGLAHRNMQHYFNLTNLLLYSAVCGTGLDTIPLPETTHEKDIEHILLDVASLSVKLHKPLSARLMPIPGKNIDDKTVYSFPYFENTAVMNPR